MHHRVDSPQQPGPAVAGVPHQAPPASSVHYDPVVIEQMAERLLARARSLLIFYTLVGVLLGVILAVAASTLTELGGVGVVGLLLLASIGYALGEERGFSLKLQAHLLLCQVSIERNTAWLARAFTAAQGPWR
jgi:hypothetical protein